MDQKMIEESRSVKKANLSNAFTLSLASRLPKNGNWFLSGFNIQSALTMIYAGASGKTKEELRYAVGGTDFIRGDLSALRAELHAGECVNLAQTLWIQTGLSVRLEYENILREHHGAMSRLVDFHGDPVGSRRIINQWAEQATGHRISEILPENAVTPETFLALVAAVHFKDAWLHPFDRSRTKVESFLSPSGVQPVRLMSNSTWFGFTKTDEYRALEMPYRSGLSMLVLLPEGPDLAVVENKVFSGELDLTQRLAGSLVHVTFPKFQMEFAFRAKEILQAMGIRRVFEPTKDLDGIAKIQGKKLYLEQVFHKASCDVNEEYTEAAASTAGLMGAQGFQGPVYETFRADHPFLYVIRENARGTILFMGRFETPES